MRPYLYFCLLASLCLFTLSSCMSPACRKAAESRTVVVDIGHYYGKNGVGVGAQTPDNRYGHMSEISFWYRYAGELKAVIEAAGYRCVLTNRGASPSDPTLAAYGKKAGVEQVNSPVPTGIYRNNFHPRRMAVGMLSVNKGMRKQPACMVFLHHNSSASHWANPNDATLFTNKVGMEFSKQVAAELNRTLVNKSFPNDGRALGIVLRDNGRLGGGDWLNACNDACIPAFISEIAYLNNPKHVQFLQNDKKARQFAQALGHAIVNYLNAR